MTDEVVLKKIERIHAQASNVVASLRGLHNSDLEEYTDLSNQLRKLIQRHSLGIEEAKQYAEEQDDERQKDTLLDSLEHHLRLNAGLCGELKKASMTTRMEQQQKERDIRESLFSGRRQDGSLKQRAARVNVDEKVLESTKDVTVSMRRIRQMMTTEVERVANVSDILDNDAKSLESTMSEHKTIGGSVDDSKKRLRNMLNRERMDKLLICGGFCFFLIVVFYIMHRRFHIGIPFVSYLF